MDGNGKRPAWFGVKSLVVVVIGIIGLGAMFYGSGIGTETSKKPPAAPVDSQSQKPVRTMNLALGPMVFLAREMDFAVKNGKGEKLDDGRIAGRIETQLSGLRDSYRQEIAKNPNLAGSMILQFSVNAAGEVGQIKEIAARLNDAEFRQTITAEIGKWSFAEIVTEPTTVQVPLLFVQEGMDITTLVRWESALTGAPAKIVAAPAAKPEAAPPAKTAAPAAPAAKPTAPPEKSTQAAVKIEGEEVQIKYATLLRKEPNFNAAIVTTFTIGSKVTVLNRSSDWLEVRAQNNGPSGYIRKEFVVPAEVVVHR